ncbi:efflux RND transporter periplasmic adaptor subunit [Thalassotalea ganghwensis]
MDVVRKKNRNPVFGGRTMQVGALVVFVAAIIWYTSGQTDVDLTVSKDRVMVTKVEKGPMEVRVSGNGVLVPDNIQWLAAQVAGRVEQVWVKAGAKVEQGQPLVRLSNPELLQRADETRWAYEAELAKLNALSVSLDAEKLNQEARVVRAQFAYESATLQLKAETTLLEQASGVVSKIDYQKTQLNVKQLERNWQIEQQVAMKSIANAEAQLLAKQAEVNRLENILNRAKQQVDNLTIYASMPGIVQESALELGQQVNIGHNVAKIADPKSLVAEIQIPELLSGDVAIDQLAKIDTRNGVIEGVVTRIDPGVVNGNVQVDIKLLGELTANARPDLSVVGEITVTNIAQTLFATRPAFVKANSANTIFKVDEAGIARKVAVNVGKTSTNQIEILSGVSQGDQLVISDTSDWANYQTILIN